LYGTECLLECFVQHRSETFHVSCKTPKELNVCENEFDGDNQVKKELIEKLLEVSRQAAREVESAVSAVKDPHVRGVIAGVIMQRILDEVDTNERSGSAPVSPVSSIYSSDPVRKSGTQSRILDLRSDSFFREPRRLEEVLEELRIKGYHHNKSDIRMSLLRLARKKLLRRIALGEGRQRMYLYVSP
jgi:dynactin complex subunit